MGAQCKTQVPPVIAMIGRTMGCLPLPVSSAADLIEQHHLIMITSISGVVDCGFSDELPDHHLQCSSTSEKTNTESCWTVGVLQWIDYVV